MQKYRILILDSLFNLLFTLLVIIAVLRYYNRCDIGFTSANFFVVFFLKGPIFLLIFVVVSLFIQKALFRYFSISSMAQWSISILAKILIAISIYIYILYSFKDYPMPSCEPLTPYF